MKVLVITVSTLALAVSAIAADDALRAKLTGKWQESAGNGETWTLKDSGDSIHLTNSGPGATIVEFDCNTLGKECAIKHAGHKSTVSLWFNGAKLVELETIGNQVVKRRFIVTGDGDTMDLETIPVTPGGETETTHFKRAPSKE